MVGQLVIRIGPTIRRLREKKGLRAKDLAALAKVDPSYISKIENKGVLPSFEKLESIGKALGVTGWKLIEMSEIINKNLESAFQKLLEYFEVEIKER